MRSEVELYFNRQACWGLSWLIGYILLMIWWFAFRDGSWAGFSLACSGAALILAGLVVVSIKMGPIIVVNTKGLKLNTGYIGTKESMEIPWDRITSVDVQKRYLPGRAHTPNNAQRVLTFQLASPLNLKSGGYFRWDPEKNELDMTSEVTTGGFKRIVSIIGDFEPRLKDNTLRADFIGPLLSRFISVLIIVTVLGSGALALKEKLNSSGPGKKRHPLAFRDQTPFEEEGRLLRKLKRVEEAGGPEDPKVFGALNELAVLYDNEKQYGKLEKVLRSIITLEKKTYGPDSCKVAHRLHSLAGIYALQPERYGDAELLYKEAIAICSKSCPEDMLLPVYMSELEKLYKMRDRE
jgi:hypothetical protein